MQTKGDLNTEGYYNLSSKTSRRRQWEGGYYGDPMVMRGPGSVRVTLPFSSGGSLQMT